MLACCRCGHRLMLMIISALLTLRALHPDVHRAARVASVQVPGVRGLPVLMMHMLFILGHLALLMIPAASFVSVTTLT